MSLNCYQIRSRLSEWVDDETADHDGILEVHLKECPGCLAFYQDLQTIKSKSNELRLADPPDQLWGRLRVQLIDEGLMDNHERTSFWQKLFPVNFLPSLKPALIGATLTLILSTSAFYFYSRHDHSGQSVTTESAVFEELKQAELHYQEAIDALSEVSSRKIDSLSPRMAQILNDNLATMDYYVKECQDAVKGNPENPLVHRYLLAAYQKKIEIMQSIVNSDVL